MVWNPQLWRTAVRIEAAYRSNRGVPESEAAPWNAWQDVTDALRRRNKAERYGWRHARRLQHVQLGRDLDHLLAVLRSLRGDLEKRRMPYLPPASELYAELVAVDDEFGGIGVDDAEIFVTTDPISLEGIYLGPFEIRLNLSRLDEQEPFRIVALEPHPADSCSDTTHPHVHNERICLGDGKAAVAAALADGRLSDLFQLIHRVLCTYGEGAAFVELDRWHGVPCSDCDDAVDEDRLYTCNNCDAALCGECARHCPCGRSACHECATVCYGCEETTCSRCLTTCPACEEEFCASCCEEGLCHACQEAEEERLVAEREAESDDDESELTVHPGGVGEDAVLARPRHHRNRRLRNLVRR